MKKRTLQKSTILDSAPKSKRFRTCPICEEGNFEKVEDIALDLDGYVIILKGERCNKCGGEFPYEHESQKEY